MKLFSLSLFIGCSTQTADVIDDPVTSNEIVEETPVEEPITEVDSCISSEDAVGVRFEGVIEYPDGSVGDGSNTRIHMCNNGCTMASWGENGFCYPEGTLSPGIYSFKVVPFGHDNHATPLGFVTIEEENVVLEQPVMVPEFESTSDVVDGVFDAGNGLEIDVVADGFTPYMGGDDFISAVPVDPKEIGLPINGLNPDNIVGMWYLGSFDADVYPSWSFQVKNLDLPVGSTVKILNSSYTDRKWLDVGSATVGEDGILYSDADSGIEILSSILLLKE
ncbi:MAG: hypothetical protein CL916_01090 [Deltaproteobacteria bacterium]|nr:hypothetical protein [Deltaproteobacteria bacterium]